MRSISLSLWSLVIFKSSALAVALRDVFGDPYPIYRAGSIIRNTTNGSVFANDTSTFSSTLLNANGLVMTNTSLSQNTSLSSNGSETTNIFLTFTITDSDGADISDTITLHHAQIPVPPAQITTPSAIQKRMDPAGLIMACDKCPQYHEFWSSECGPVRRGIRAFTVTCQNFFIDEDHLIEEMCPPDWLCLQGFTQDEGMGTRPMAYCISGDAYMLIIDSVKVGTVSAMQDPLMRAILGQTSGGVVATLAGLDGESVLAADSLNIQAQSRHSMYGTDIWGTLPGGVKQCADCNSLVLQPVPAAAQRLHVDFVLPKTSVGGRLYLTSFMLPS